MDKRQEQRNHKAIVITAFLLQAAVQCYVIDEKKTVKDNPTAYGIAYNYFLIDH